MATSRSWLIGAALAIAALFSRPVGAQEAAPAIGTPTIYVAGDSTAANGEDAARGWARHLASFFDADKVHIENRARGGRSSRTFVTEGLWEDIRTHLHPGDVVLIQFGHNDGGAINDAQRARGSLPGLGEETQAIDNLQTHSHEVVHTYGWYMRKMIAETRAQGGFPVVASLTVRNIWDEAGHVERGAGQYGQWARELAGAENVPFIDLTNLAADAYERMGQAEVAALFPRDHTHTSDAGALINARLVVEGFKGLREEMWSGWFSPEGRAVPRAAPNYVAFPRIERGADAASQQRFLNTPEPSVASLPTLWLVGDSTVRTGRGRGELGQFGWGDPLQNYFDLNKINVVNRAVGGTGARTFRSGGLWAPVLAQIKPGDVVLIQFGHNDNGERGALAGIGRQTERRTSADGHTERVESFGAYLRRYVREIRLRRATPILFSPIPRKIWADGRIDRAQDQHVAWMRQVATSERVLFVDLNERIAQRYDLMGAEAVEPMFADGRVHTSYGGAALNAACVMAGLRDLRGDPLQQYLLADEAQAAARYAGALTTC